MSRELLWRASFLLGFGLVLVALLGLNADWHVTCPETGATGFMDCAGQRDARWESDELPAWVTLDLVLGGLALGALVLTGLLLACVASRCRDGRAGGTWRGGRTSRSRPRAEDLERPR